ncbi:MAG: YicC/YloC family endoribonuclease [Myxococcota bacterium]
MIRSMTGYGRSAFNVGGVDFDVEVRTVNHRYLDSRVKLPRLLGERELDVKSRIQDRLDRGKVDLTVSTGGGAAAAPRLRLDLGCAEQYIEAAQQLKQRDEVAGDLDVTSLLSLPGVTRFEEPELSADELSAALMAAVDEALEAVDAMRVREGEALARELAGRMARVRSLADTFESRSQAVQDSVRERLRKRAESLRQETGLLDEARLHQEIVIAADKLDVTEEVVRLRSHVDQFEQIVAGGEAGQPVGRRLDFLLQEMGREANTIGSKGSDAPIAHDVVDLKTELERIREQVQNVE